jgi:serine/threonine protein phosphatase PrpC
MVEELQISVKEGTDVGKVRDHNEDFVLIPVPGEAERMAKGQLFIVADGMGGYQAGEVASEMAARTVAQQYYADPSQDPSARLRNAVQSANAEVHRQAQSNTAHIGMGTTIVAAALVGRKAFIASVGDSRAYVIHNGKLDQITQDHSFVGEQVRAGILTKEQARSHPQRNVITRALGSQPAVSVDTFSGELTEGDSLVLCTDGLSGHVPDDGIRDTVLQNPPDQAVQKLIQMAKDDGGTDNITVIVLHVEPPVTVKIKPVAAVEPPSAKPAAAKPPPKTTRSSSSLIWAIGGVVLALVVLVIIGASMLVFNKWPGSSPTATPTVAPPSPAPQVPTALPGGGIVTPSEPSPTQVTATPRATFTATNTPRPLPTVKPSETPTQTPEVTLTPSATKEDKGEPGGGEPPPR